MIMREFFFSLLTKESERERDFRGRFVSLFNTETEHEWIIAAAAAAA
jgi:hypothetical protein